MKNETQAAKQALRELIRRRKREHTAEELATLSAEVIGRLTAHPRMQAARTVLLYCSLPDEVDTHGCIARLHAEGKTVLLPKVVDGERLELRRYTGHESMQPGAFGIMEPTGPAYPRPLDIDVAVVPGMSFDAHGNRLGRGKGYYDRLLARLAHAYKIGICFDFQKTDCVPCEATDQPMDEVL